jgi:hypothetical protein
MVCELYYAGGLGAVWWDEAHIGLYTGIGIQFYFILLFVFLEFLSRFSAFVSEEKTWLCRFIILWLKLHT